MKSKGLELIAVNRGDSKDQINKYVKEGSFTFPIVMGGQADGKNYAVPEKYGVQAYPTNYILDSEGNVVHADVGFNEKAIRAAIEKLGVK